MQYRLSTIFLVFFVVAASLAAFGTTFGLVAAGGVFTLALLNYWIKCFSITEWLVIISIIGVLVGLLLPAVQSGGGGRRMCRRNLDEIGSALNNYYDTHKHFPPLITCDKNGKPLYNWLVEILPQLDCAPIYDELNKDEPWNSPQNVKVVGHRWIYQYKCPYAFKDKKDLSANYIAIVGPGTIWRSEGTTSREELPQNPKFTVAAVECAVSEKHWAEPCILTVEEALERMKTGEGMRISTAHLKDDCVQILFADGSTWSLSSRMPLSMWRKLLRGEIKSYNELHEWKSDSGEPVPVKMWLNEPPPPPAKWPFLLSIAVWFVSVILLFRRAWKSREARKKAAETPA